MAGLLHAFVPQRFIQWLLGTRGIWGAVKGALAGAPLPLCSCGVIPTALSLRRQGASLSSTFSFMVSTPETSIDALVITVAMLPLTFVGVRPLAAIVLSILVGVVIERFSNVTPQKQKSENLHDHHLVDEACCEERTDKTFGSKIMSAIHYGFWTFFQDIALWIVLGLGIAALLIVLLPENAFHVIGNPVLQIVLAISVGIPLYSCAAATTPFAAVLLAKGMDPGAVLALLLSGPATNIGNFFVLKKEFGWKTTVFYYALLFIGCLGIGWIFSLFWPSIQHVFPSWTTLPLRASISQEPQPSNVLEQVAAAIFLSMLAVSVFKKKLHQEEH